ncbi:HTH-type transcriptional regulator AdhR [Slackia heliotrinireducens]|uniref:Predicted transcriptional regulator n=1 Tax=Slackia heliotrinireducens (strain ATCC 29202 / DSM 20476 / NCTC 11029 / RHS 1) TaxID=471855 RepID=C7N0T7_SLAHD|nr:MerR family transcriptional regulator [Slackia heliotrinireducens]ACV21165.1 predicted transcriptional regulator [Slackia heliotrinireducens DSM 20476]VEG98600.1 HTH-type transcriptional regulator AdhR [Slackia heliotrinireducens]
MTYTIGQISEMFGLPISTLRYYDKEGLFPYLERTSGIRKFTDTEIDALNVIECLKGSGLEIRDIKRFMDWCTQGPDTYPQRKELFETRLAAIEEEIAQLSRMRDMLKYKCWYYDTAIADGSEDRILAMLPDNLPEGIQELYDNGNSASVR